MMASKTNILAKEETVALRKNQRQATLSLYEETIRRIDEAKKNKNARPISITLTPDESSRQTILLSSTGYLSPISAPLPERKVSITFSRDVQIFEFPKPEYIDPLHIDNESNYDSPDIELSKSTSSDLGHDLQTANRELENNCDSDSENNNELLGIPVPSVKNQFQSLTGYSPRPSPKFHSPEPGNYKNQSNIEISDSSPGNNSIEKENKNNTSDNNNEKRNTKASSKSIDTLEMRSKYHNSCVEIVKKSINNQNVYLIKGILKPERPCSRVIMSCETSGAHFEDRCIPLYKKEETNIGRFSKFGGEKPDVHNAIFNCRVMSREHASIFYQDGSFFIRDLNSSNGTYLILDGKDKMCINKETNNSILEVFSGDVIQFGQDIPEIIRRNSYSNPREKIKEKRITKCIRTTLRLFHPSSEECKSRKGDDGVNTYLDTMKTENLSPIQRN